MKHFRNLNNIKRLALFALFCTVLCLSVIPISVSAIMSESVTSSASGNITPDIAPVITTATLNNAVINESYSATLAASGFPAPTFSVTSGTLPTGLTLSTAGVLSGTPTVSGIYTFTVTADNGIDPPSTDDATGSAATKEYTVKVVHNHVPYLDQNGDTQYADNVLSVNSTTASDALNGWFIVDTDYAFHGITAENTNLILANGKTLSLESSVSCRGQMLNIYAQSATASAGAISATHIIDSYYDTILNISDGKISFVTDYNGFYVLAETVADNVWIWIVASIVAAGAVVAGLFFFVKSKNRKAL